MAKLLKIYGEENAHVTEDYPYGFRLRTERKEWIETKKGKQRFCTQTKDPKRGVWNKPKCSTYDDVIVAFEELDSELGKDVVKTESLRLNDTEEKVNAFREKYKEVLIPEQDDSMKMIIAWDRANKKVSWKVGGASESTQTIDDQRRILGHLTANELKKMEQK
jgi:hypothetical protein